jgi:hypothetical protein
MKAWLAAALVAATSGVAAGQAHPDTPLTEAVEEHEKKVDYAIPDAPSDLVHRLTSFDTKFFSLKLGLVVIGDYTAFYQNQPSIDQVGEQRDQARASSSSQTPGST